MKIKKYLAVRTVLKPSWKITERHNFKFDTPKRRKFLKQNINIYTSYFCLEGNLILFSVIECFSKTYNPLIYIYCMVVTCLDICIIYFISSDCIMNSFIILYNILKIAELDCCQIIILSIYIYHLHTLIHMSYVYPYIKILARQGNTTTIEALLIGSGCSRVV